MIPLIFYSHSDYSDVWAPMFAQAEKYLKGYKKYLFTDQSTEDLDNEWIIIKYDDSLPYQKRMLHCLEQVEEGIILFHHEDMFLFGQPNEEKLKQLVSLVGNGDIDIVKLARASYDASHPLIRNTTHENVYENPNNLKFAIQPSICKKEKLELIYSKTYGNSIWEFEANSSMICDYFNIKTGMTWEEEDNKRGMFHWDSGIYPYFATAIVKGKWSIKEYGDLLGDILEENKIEISKRGTT
tara:strand:+ start:1197 stop:1916 length:720 start_codon:yes stop_codon:yes gene_type:complete